MGRSADPSLNGQLKYPNNLDQLFNDAASTIFREIDRFFAASGVQLA
jgi:hypothetical protein